MSESTETTRLLKRADEGDRQALNELFERHRKRLLRMVQMRLDVRLRGRIDASDVIQETHVEAFRRFEAYLKDNEMPFFHWLRFLAGQKVLELHRRHLGAQRRDARREVRLYKAPLPGANSESLALQLLGKQTAPSQAAIRAELRVRLEEAFRLMDPLDREILSLRHFEQLTNAEVALELGMKTSAASKRFIRAAEKLRKILDAMPGTDGLLSR